MLWLLSSHRLSKASISPCHRPFKVYNLCLVLPSLLRLFWIGLGLFSFFLMLRAISWNLFESCPDSLILAVGPPGAPILICTCSLHATCLGICLVARLGLGLSQRHFSCCLGVRAFCCLEVVVDGCWLCCSNQCPANGLPREVGCFLGPIRLA